MFLENATTYIKELTKPLVSIGLTNFMHDITFGNNQIAMLNCSKNIFLHYHQNKIPMLCTNKYGRMLDDGIYLNKILESQHKDCSVLMPLMVKVGKQFKQNFGKYSLHIARNESSCQHLYSLFFDLSENEFLYWVINNGNLLNDFISNYNDRANETISEAKSPENRILLPNSNLNNTENIKLASVIHKTLSVPIYLSNQQEKCIQLLMKGKSIKEIALDMNLSPRTIEHYLERVKIILGCTSNRELITSYFEQFR